MGEKREGQLQRDMDIIDEANRYNEFYQDLARRNYDASRTKPDEQSLYIGDKRCCLDCKDPIDPRRLEAKPDAVRCTECAAIKELKP